MIRIKIDGLDEVVAALDAAPEDIRRELGQAVKATGIEARAEIVRGYQSGPASGRIYTKYPPRRTPRKSRPRRTHQASAPGEAPMSDTGRLASSVVFREVGELAAEVATEEENGAVAEYGATAEYGAMLEWGTRTIEPRPLWVPVSEALRPKFVKRAEAAIKRILKKMGR